MYYIVYKTTCTINNKIYIGVHKTEDPYNFDGYYGNGISLSNMHFARFPKYPFHYAFNKYGKDNFTRETIAIFDNGDDAFALEAEIVNPAFINSDDNYNIALGGSRNQTTKGKIYVFNCKGEFIEEFECCLDAVKPYNVSDKSIRESANKKVSRKGFLFSWTREINIAEYYIYPKYRTYYLYDKNKNLVKEFNNREEMKDFFNSIGNINNLDRAMKRGYLYYGYYIRRQKWV